MFILISYLNNNDLNKTSESWDALTAKYVMAGGDTEILINTRPVKLECAYLYTQPCI